MSLIKKIKNVVFPKLNQKAKYFALPEFKQERGIPKILHQVYFSQTAQPATLPQEISDNIDHIKALNPGWEHKLYGRDDMIQFIVANYGGEMLQYFERIDPAYGAARADFFRYLLLYACGGVYLDVKSAVTSPLDDFLRPDDAFILSQWKNQPQDEFEGWGLHYEVKEIPGGEFQQWHIIAAPGHPFLRAVIEQVLTNIDLYIPSLHGVAKKGVLRTTGPMAYTLAIAPLLTLHPHRVVNGDPAFPLKYSIYGYDAHFDVFKSHYSRLVIPLVKIGPAKQLFSTFITGLNKVQEYMKNRRHSR